MKGFSDGLLLVIRIRSIFEIIIKEINGWTYRNQLSKSLKEDALIKKVMLFVWCNFQDIIQF